MAEVYEMNGGMSAVESDSLEDQEALAAEYILGYREWVEEL
jgi:hypothetical protein